MAENPYERLRFTDHSMAPRRLEPTLLLEDLDAMVARKLRRLERVHEDALLDAQETAWNEGRQAGWSDGQREGRQFVYEQLRGVLAGMRSVHEHLEREAVSEKRTTLEKLREMLAFESGRVQGLAARIRTMGGDDDG